MIRAPQDPDHALVRACLDPNDDGFEAAFEALYEMYRDRVYSIAYRMLGSTTDAMDVVQEAFSLVFRKISSFRFDSKFSTWLFRLVVNCCVDLKRRESNRALRGMQDEANQTASGVASPVAAAESAELGDHVQVSLQLLSPKLRAVLVLRYIEGLSYDELSQSLNVSLGTVKSRLARAHLAFETVLSGTLEPFGYPFAGQRGRGMGQRPRPSSNDAEGVA